MRASLTSTGRWRRAYRERRAAVAGAERPRLIEEQRAWLRRREGCKTAAAPIACIEDLYRKRIDQLADGATASGDNGGAAVPRAATADDATADAATADAATVDAARPGSPRSNAPGTQSQQRLGASAAAAEAVSCQAAKFVNLTKDQGKALQFIFEQKKGLRGLGCTIEVVAHDKIPFRGLLLVKYSASVSFPTGYRTDCLDIKKEDQIGPGLFRKIGEGCSEMSYKLSPLGPPAKPGETRRYTEEDII